MKEWIAGATAVLCAAGMLACSNARARAARGRTSPPGPAPLTAPLQNTFPASGVIPAGTTLVIRTEQQIHTDQAGQAFAARVEQDIMDQSGRLLVPRGSAAELTVLETSAAGTTGTPVRELAIQSVTVAGQRYAVASGSAEEREEQGLAGSVAAEQNAAEGALLGTLIGAAVADRGSEPGAAAYQVLTRGKRVEAPANAVLTFRLDQPCHLRADSQ